MTFDDYGEVINSQETYEDIVAHLKARFAVIIGWTDQEGTHYDILFQYSCIDLGGGLQGGINQRDLYVSIMRKGAFGFDVYDTDTEWGYYAEKLGGRLGETTGKKLAELINGVKKAILDSQIQAKMIEGKKPNAW